MRRLESFRKGAQVTMVIKGSEIGKRVKYWVRPDIVNRIEEGSIKAYYNSQLIADPGKGSGHQHSGRETDYYQMIMFC